MNLRARIGEALARVFSDSERRVARQSFWMNAIFAARLFGGLAAVYMTARILGVDGFGALALISSLCAVVFGLANAAVSTVTTFAARALAEGRTDEAERVFRFSVAFSLAAALVAYAIIAALALAAGGALGIPPEHRSAALAFAAGGALASAVYSARGLLYLADRMGLAALVAAASNLLYVALIAAAWAGGGGLMQVALARAVAETALGLGTLAAAVASAPRAGLAGLLRSASLRVPPDVARFSVAGAWTNGVNSLVNGLDAILLARLAGAAGVSQAGLYGAARRVADIAASVAHLARGAARTEYSALWYAGRGARLRSVALRVNGATLAASLAIVIPLALLRDPIMRYLLGADFADAGAPLLILLLGVLAIPTIRSLTLAAGRPMPTAISALIALIAFAAVISALAPTRGATGAAWARTAFFWTDFAIALPFAIAVFREAGMRKGGGEG